MVRVSTLQDSLEYLIKHLNSPYLSLLTLLPIIFITINCGPMPSERLPIPETTSSKLTSTNDTSNQVVKLPKAALVDLKEILFLRKALTNSQTSVSSRGGLEDFHVKSRANVRHSAIISNCNLDIIKAFIAQGWAPIVRYENHGRNAEIIPVSEYNDHTQQLSLQQVNGNVKRRVDYKDFDPSFNRSSRKQCVLITPIQLSEANIRKVLSKYLPSDSFAQISVRSR